ncbi:MAG: hypothetical protein HQL81_14100 [Magnetococcales bacterium]|nr:hypothetical protein [Magnetococcales bacterium]
MTINDFWNLFQKANHSVVRREPAWWWLNGSAVAFVVERDGIKVEAEI